MGWLSRAKKTGGADSAEAPTPMPEPPASRPAPSTVGEPGAPGGRYGPLVTITSFDPAPVELTWQLPVTGELYRLMPGPDRSDYSVMVLERPVHFYPPEGFDATRVPADRRVPDRKGRPMVRVDALVVCSRFTGQQLHPHMHDLAVNVAYVIDDRVLTDEALDLATIEYVGVGRLSAGRASTRPAPAGGSGSAAGRQPQPPPVQTVPAGPAAEQAGRPVATAEPVTGQSATGQSETGQPPTQPLPRPGAETPAPELSVEVPAPPGPSPAASDWILGEAARVLREGIEAERGRPVEQLTARLGLDAAGRVVALSGNADGTAPVPSRETWDRLRALLGGLSAVTDVPIATLSVRVAGGRLSWEAAPGR
ncbi:hypothetical protein [Intrasporangium sp.]|uniref:hypothetical protein n=1 Tax=Intrasporangium sp. TaxID=1925024 RepID=UPI003221AA84